MIAAAYPPLTPSDASRQLPRRGSLIPLWQSAASVQTPLSRPSSFVSRKSSGDPMGAAAASLFAGIRRSSHWSLLEDSGETSFSNRNLAFRFEEEEPPSDTEFSQYYGSAETERATCVPTRPAGGDGTELRAAEASGEYAETWRIARCGGDERREQDEGYFAPAGATFFRSAAKEGKGAPGEPFHKGSPGPLLTAKGLRPIGSPAGVYEGRRMEASNFRC